MTGAVNPIDWDQLGPIAGDWDEEISAIYAEFLASAGADLEKLGALLAAGEAGVAAAVAHRLKGSAANFGFSWLSAEAAAIERACREKGCEGCGEALARAAAAFEAGRAEVSARRS